MEKSIDVPLPQPPVPLSKSQIIVLDHRTNVASTASNLEMLPLVVDIPSATMIPSRSPTQLFGKSSSAKEITTGASIVSQSSLVSNGSRKLFKLPIKLVTECSSKDSASSQGQEPKMSLFEQLKARFTGGAKRASSGSFQSTPKGVIPPDGDKAGLMKQLIQTSTAHSNNNNTSVNIVNFNFYNKDTPAVNAEEIVASASSSLKLE